ncbi:unnamed protein product [Staurois parvus]|uniref:Uncharacterized protein n=1 Tax=Staurois parvus TaxID=386267 RepID=A0ABN9B4E3_9NEOB|nr:unnamed protein product [Staurois parvus]
MSAVSHNPTKPLDDQVWSSSSTNKASDKQQPMRSLNMNNVSNEQHNKDKDLLLANLGKTMKKHAAHNVSRHAPSKTLCFANTDILLDKEPLSSPSVSKTSGEQHKGTPVPTTVLVHAVNSHAMDVPVDQTATVPQRQIKSVGHVSAITTGTDLSIVQPSCSSRVDNKCTEMASSSPRAKETFHVKELLIKEALTSREEAPLTSPGVKGGTTSEVEKATCRPSLLHLKALSYQLKQGYFLQSFKKINVQLPSNGKSLSTLQSKVVDLVSEQSPEHSIISQQTQNYLGDVEENLENSGGATSEQTSEHHIISQQKYLSRVDGDLRKSGQTADEPATLDDLLDDGDMVVKEITHEDEDTVLCGQTEEEPASSGGLLEDGDMAVEEMTHAVEDTVLLYGQTADEPASPGNRPEDGPMLVKEITPANEDTVLLTGQTADEPASSRDLQEDEPMLVEEITHTDEDPSGFPANVDKSMYLSIDQKSKLMESYKEAEEQMSRTGDTTKAAQAFWDLCRENKCREFLLTLVTCYMKSVFHKIVHEQPKDRDFEQAFSFLQASECFAEFMNGTEDDQAKINSRTSSRETYSESDSESVGFSTEVKDQEEITRDKDPDGMKPESPEPSHTSNKVGQCTTEEDRNKVETECSKTFSLSVNRKVKESSEGKDHNGIQCESSLESNRTEKISGGEQHDDVQGESRESSSESSRKEQSTVGIDIDRMETELAAASRFFTFSKQQK